MSFFREHDPDLDEPEDHRTDFDRWVDSWIWTPRAIMVYAAIVIFGVASGCFKWIAGAFVVMAFVVALLGAAMVQEIRGG